VIGGEVEKSQSQLSNCLFFLALNIFVWPALDAMPVSVAKPLPRSAAGAKKAGVYEYINYNTRYYYLNNHCIYLPYIH
jgi:hypothetical protein